MQFWTKKSSLFYYFYIKKFTITKISKPQLQTVSIFDSSRTTFLLFHKEKHSNFKHDQKRHQQLNNHHAQNTPFPSKSPNDPASSSNESSSISYRTPASKTSAASLGSAGLRNLASEKPSVSSSHLDNLSARLLCASFCSFRVRPAHFIYFEFSFFCRPVQL